MGGEGSLAFATPIELNGVAVLRRHGHNAVTIRRSVLRTNLEARLDCPASSVELARRRALNRLVRRIEEILCVESHGDDSRQAEAKREIHYAAPALYDVGQRGIAGSVNPVASAVEQQRRG